VAFLERLRGYLERVEREPEGLPVIRVDVAAHRQHLAEASDPVIERVIARAEPPRATAADHKRLEEQLERMRERRELLPAFVEEVADQIVETLAPSASQEEVTRLINVAIRSEFWDGWGPSERRGPWEGYNSMTGSQGFDEEMGRVAELARARLRWRSHRDGWESPARYAFEIRAIVRRRADRHTLTRSGAAFLGLPGIDAVRWLLALESAQSLGPMDDWRISSELAAQLLSEPQRAVGAEELADGSWRFSLPTIRRLEALKLVHYEGQDLKRGKTSFSYAIFDRARPLLEEIAEQRPTPFAVLADALLRDEVAHTLDGARPGAERALHDSAAASTALQARMVVHEIRNALIPAQIAFARLDRELGETQPELLQRQRGRVSAGLQRALTFADEMLRVANLGVEPAAIFDAAAAIQDAIAGVKPDLNGSLRYSPPDGMLLVAGPRARFVLAVTNLLRNAAQAVVGTEGIVEVSLEEREDRIAIRVDDNGPGVAIEHRHTVFEPGVALRPGGSGQGLALVWQVVVGEMLGSVACEASPLGGARFVLVVPVKGMKGK
jgi:signal transduction histidine kinase